MSADVFVVDGDNYVQALEFEARRQWIFEQALEEFILAAELMWRFGDGDGGYVHEALHKAMHEAFPSTRPAPSRPNPKRPKISATLRTSVYERDQYRCVKCGTQKRLTLDHIHPQSLGGEHTFENLQTMCRSCNSSKGARV